jgi:hypothetical protein
MPKGKPNKKPVVKQSEIGNELHHPADAGYKYHATFCPTWRTELDCGEFDSLEEAQQSLADCATELEVTVNLGWYSDIPNTWLATGNDGQVETVMTIAKIERVAE